MAFSYSFWNISSDSGSRLSETSPELPTRAMSCLLKNLYFAENPWTRLGTCQVMVLRYRQCFSSAFQIVLRFLGCSKITIEKSGFCTLATLAIQRSVKFSGKTSVSRYRRFFLIPNPVVAPAFSLDFSLV